MDQTPVVMEMKRTSEEANGHGWMNPTLPNTRARSSRQIRLLIRAAKHVLDLDGHPSLD
jgi:hypothetical protein